MLKSLPLPTSSRPRVSAFCDRYEVPRAYPSHTELLKDDEVQAVAVTLGHQLHHRLTVDALNAGKHVLVEKPMALSLQQCDDMIEAARRNNVKLMIGLTQHFLGPNMKAKQILDSGELGPLITAVCYSVKNWGFANRRPQYRSRFHGGGYWMTNGVHMVDRLTWLVGSQAARVKARIGTKSHYQAGDDYGVAFVDYKNGVPGIAIAIGYRDGAPNYQSEIICANGGVRLSGSGDRYVAVGRGNEWTRVAFEDPPAGMTEEWRAFARSIEEDLEPPTSGDWGRHIMEILFAAERSSITGQQVTLAGGTTNTTSRPPARSFHPTTAGSKMPRPPVGAVAGYAQRSSGMKTLDPRTASAARYHPATSRIPRRLVLRLAASAGAAAVLAGCGEKELTRDSYDFPGARKDSTGNYQMRNAQ